MITGITASQLRSRSVLSVTDAILEEPEPFIDVVDATFALDLQVSVSDAVMGLPRRVPRMNVDHFTFYRAGNEQTYYPSDTISDEMGVLTVFGGIYGNVRPEGVIIRLEVRRGASAAWADTNTQAGWDEENAQLYGQDPYYTNHNLSEGLQGYGIIYYRWHAYDAETNADLGASDETTYFQVGLV